MADRTAIHDVMTLAEVAEDRGIHYQTVKSAIASGALKEVRKSGATWLLLRSEIEAQWPNGGHRGRRISPSSPDRAGHQPF